MTVDHDDVRQRQSKAVAKAITSLGDKMGYDADIVFEGALRGACALLMARGDSADTVAKLLEQSARLIRTLDQER